LLGIPARASGRQVIPGNGPLGIDKSIALGATG
jgi:hypothetical protein